MNGRRYSDASPPAAGTHVAVDAEQLARATRGTAPRAAPASPSRRADRLNRAAFGLGPERGERAVGLAVGLEPLEDLLPVVQHHRRRVEGERPVRHHRGVVPAARPSSSRIEHHVVGEVPAEPGRRPGSRRDGCRHGAGAGCGMPDSERSGRGRHAPAISRSDVRSSPMRVVDRQRWVSGRATNGGLTTSHAQRAGRGRRRATSSSAGTPARCRSAPARCPAFSVGENVPDVVSPIRLAVASSTASPARGTPRSGGPQPPAAAAPARPPSRRAAPRGPRTPACSSRPPSRCRACTGVMSGPRSWPCSG